MVNRLVSAHLKQLLAHVTLVFISSAPKLFALFFQNPLGEDKFGPSHQRNELQYKTRCTLRFTSRSFVACLTIFDRWHPVASRCHQWPRSTISLPPRFCE